MPTGEKENAELTAGRVTRSLRKRLTSIDGDASSRPGTPNLISLQTIPETNTPTKRLTRRASLSTPAAVTPSKETTNTPGRRVNRRRSINISDSEDNAISVQPISKEPTITVVKEEPESPKGKAKRVLRSSSKSPNESDNTTTKSKRGRKKIIKEEEPETIVPDNTSEEESVKTHSTQKKPRVSIKKETIVEEEIKKQQQNTPNKSDSTSEQVENDNKSSMKSPTKRGSLLTQTTPDSKKCLSAQKERRISESIIASQQSPSQKISCFSLSQPLAQSTQKSPSKKNNPEPLKNVLFTESDDENEEKTVYPKTPGLVKSKSYILDGSNNVDKDDTFKSSKKDQSEAGSFDDDKEVGEETAVLDTKTPHKLKLLGGVDSSTPIQQKNSPQKTPKSVEILAKDIAAKEYVFSEDDDDDKQQLSSFQKSFSQSFSRNAGNLPKVDPVVQEKSIADKKTEGVANKSQSNTPSSNMTNKSNQIKTIDSDLSGDEIDNLVRYVDGTDKIESVVQNVKVPYVSKPLLAVQESTPIQPKSSPQQKMKSEEILLRNPAKEYLFSDDDDDENEKQKEGSPQKSTNTSVSEAMKGDDAKNKSLTINTSKKSSPTKSPLSRMQCSDSSEEDGDDLVEKGDNKEVKSINKSLIAKSPNKSLISTPTKSTHKKLRLSKAQCSDSSEDDEELIEKDNNKEQNESATQIPKSPNKAKPLATEKSTPTTQNKSPQKKSKSIEFQQTDVICSADDGNNEEKQNVVDFPTSWNTGVSGTNTQVSKLDCITPEKSMSKTEDTEDKSKAQNNISVEKRCGRKTIDSDTSDDDIDMREDGYKFDEDEGEDENREKSMYIDDEAMEVPPGEESSYSEDENALPEYGESIGSQDSPEEDIDDVDGDDEPDEDDEAFIVSDTEPIEELLSSEGEVLDKPEKQKKYQRIYQASDSSDDEEVQIPANATSPNKDETDICLLVDSSLEHDKDDDVKVAMDTKTLDKSLKEDIKIEKKEHPRRSARKSNNSRNDTDNNKIFTEQSKLNKTVQDIDSNSDSGLREEEVEIDRSKPIVLEQIIIAPIRIEQEQQAAQKLTKSPSKRRSAASTINNDESEVDNILDEDQKPLNQSRKSLKAKNEKSPSKKLRKRIIAVNLDSSDEDDVALDVKALSPSQIEEESEADGKSQKSSISQSRKSLVRTSTEETNKSEDENNLEKTTFELEEKEPEPEDTLAASKTEKRSKNKSGSKEDLNISGRRSRNVSLQEEFEATTKSRKSSSFNESRKSLVRTSTEETNENEETLSAHETSKKLLENQDCNEVETKSQRRESITAQKSISLQDSEHSADSEEEKQQKSQTSDVEEGEEKGNNSSPEATDAEMENSRNDPAEAQFSDGEDDDEKSAANQTVSSFLGETSVKQNASRRKSIAANESSKLDETFQLNSKNSPPSSLHESLHRNVLKQNLNQKRRQTIDVTTRSNNSSDSEDEDNSSAVEGELEIKKKVISEKGLSVSLNSFKIKKEKLKQRKEIRNSFTIGVSLRMNSSEDESSSSKPEPERALGNGDASSDDEQGPSDDGENEDSSESEGKLLNESEQEVLEKVKNVQTVVPHKSRKSLSILAPPPSDTSDVKPKKAIKRTSLYLQEDAASSSFVEDLAEEKKKIKHQKRKSNSFCGVLKPPSEDDDEFVQRPPEPRSEKKLKKLSESSGGNKEVNVSKVLSRCEQMLEAANEAKRQAKMQAKKVKVKKPKWMDKDEKATAKEGDQVTIPLVSKKEIKRKEKLKKELEKALKHSAAVLTKAADPALKNKQKNVSAKPTTKIASPSKRLDADFLESLIQLSNQSKKKTKAIETTPPSDKENSKKKSQKQKYKIEDVHTQIESEIETLETACGTVIVEPSTPKKLRIQHGFRESPKTPAGYKIQDITALSNKKSNHKSNQRKFKTSSGAFIEEDVKTSKTNIDKKRKRKLPFIEEPSHTLPKTQWTRSGVFYEEDLTYPRPLANSTATQFLVASLNISKKNKPAALTISATTMDKALSFKNKAVKEKKVSRVSSREVLFSKQRSAVNKQF